MIQLRRIGHAIFETSDIGAAVSYYTGIMGLKLVTGDKSSAVLATHGGLIAVVLKAATQSRCAGLAFEVGNIDLADAAKKLGEHGVRSESKADPSPGIAKSLSFTDPNGTSIEIFSEAKPVHHDKRPDGVAPLKLGHVAFYSKSPLEMAKFYQEVLGFKLSDWIEDFFVFMRCNADHHTVNFLQGDRPRVHHVAFELRDAAHVSAACDILTARNVPLVWGPLRLGPGHNIATFHRNSDAQLIEFYAELDQMKDEVLGYWDPKPWHRDWCQRPKVWKREEDPIWGPMPPAGFL